jgi:hypothetical protein
MPHYTQEQVEKANRTDLVFFLEAHGEHLKRKGTSHLWEKHQVWIRDHLWYSHYDSTGGYPIGFVMRYFGMGFQDAVAELLGCTTYGLTPQGKKDLILPQRSNSMDCVFAYLMQKRFIARDVIAHFAHTRTLYEDAQYHNCIFVGTDEEGIPRHIHRRGTQGSFKQTDAGSKSEYSFHHDGDSDTLYVFEAPIDMLAFITLHPNNWKQHSYVALCSVSERAILHRLRVNPKLKKVILCLDHDNAGITACYRIKDILNVKGYDDVQFLHSENKDWGEDTKAMHGVAPIKAEADASKAIYALCDDFVYMAKHEKKPQHLLSKVNAVATSIANKIPTVNQKQIDQFIVLLLLLSVDECRKSMHDVTWSEIAEKLMAQYVPHADNGNTEMRLRQIGNDMRELSRVYAIPNMTYDADLFVKPILRVAMDCIRLTNYLERKE